MKQEYIGVDKKIISSLKAAQMEAPTRIQQAVLERLEEHKDENLLAASKTGSGKTLAYVIPILNRLLEDETHTALAILPTRELALQTVEVFKTTIKNILPKPKRGLHAVAVVGGLFVEKQLRLLSKHPHIVVATPGRLNQLLQENEMMRAQIENTKTLVLDEADRLFEHRCFPDLKPVCKALPSQLQILVFSATLHMRDGNKNTVSFLWNLKNVFSREFHVIDLSPPNTVAGNITHLVAITKHEHKSAALLFFISQKHGRKLVFTNSIGTAKRLSRALSLLGQSTVCLHGKMLQKNRLAKLDELREREDISVVCTDLAARGLDIKDIVAVVNYHCPATARTYIHRVGRTARAGACGTVLDILSGEETETHEKIQKELSITAEQLSLPAMETAAGIAALSENIAEREEHARDELAEMKLSDLRRLLEKNKNRLHKTLSSFVLKRETQDTPAVAGVERNSSEKTLAALQKLKDDSKAFEKRQNDKARTGPGH
ncbi:MAG: ATP-dependent RNA helicase [Amphiamblys sp. WSBS2006]|nr:MAG: ATP-dependent RNA helicase [Amphiamblys sp. WSBS2006]